MDLSKINKEFFRIGDRSKEEFIYVFNKSEELPLNIDCAGITYPTPDYFIKRSNAPYFVFEQVLSGEGSLVYNGKEHRLCAGDFYCLEPYSDQYYHSDPKKPMKKIWINFYCDFFSTTQSERKTALHFARLKQFLNDGALSDCVKEMHF